MARTPTGEMRALVARNGAAEGTTVPLPALRDGLVLVRITHALVTPFERESLRGLAAAQALGDGEGGADARRILGTSFVGVVEDASRGGSHAPARGMRVAVQPVFSCGICERCDSGIGIHCLARSVAGLDSAIGGLAEFAAVPASSCVEIPPSLDEERATFAVALARAIEAVRRGGIEGRSFVSVLGDDLFAVLAALVAVEENPLARLVAGREATLAIAAQYGIRHRALDEVGRRGDQELVIDMTGSPETIGAACRMVGPRGHVVVGGISACAPVAVDLSHLALDEIEMFGSGFGELASALEQLARARVDPSALLSRRLSLADAASAIPMLAEPGVFSVLVRVDR